jgi:hypothetical protein
MSENMLQKHLKIAFKSIFNQFQFFKISGIDAQPQELQACVPSDSCGSNGKVVGWFFVLLLNW